MTTPVQNQDVRFHQSVTGYLNEVANGRLTVNEENGKIMTVAKLAAHTVTSAVLATAGLVESVIRHVLAVVAKLLTVIVPKGYSTKLDENVIKPLFQHAALTAKESAGAFSKLVSNFMSQESRDNVHAKINSAMDTVYSSNFMDKTERLHINGFSEESVEVKDQNANADFKAKADAFQAQKAKEEGFHEAVAKLEAKAEKKEKKANAHWKAKADAHQGQKAAEANVAAK